MTEPCAHCEHTKKAATAEPKNRREWLKLRLKHGNWVWPLVTVILSAGLGSLVTSAIGWWHIGPEDGLLILGLVGFLFVGVGTFLRAAAHNNDDLKWLDHVGKLCAIGAAAFAFWGITGRAAASLQSLWLPDVLWSVLIAMLIAGGLVLIWIVIKYWSQIREWAVGVIKPRTR